jgi:hypothetical protein
MSPQANAANILSETANRRQHANKSPSPKLILATAHTMVETTTLFTVADLLSELRIARKLLFKHQNQHRGTKHFLHFRQARRGLRACSALESTHIFLV